MFNYIEIPKICKLFEEDIDMIIDERIKDEDRDSVYLLKECCDSSTFLNNISKIIDFDFNKFIDEKIENDPHINLIINKILLKDYMHLFMAYNKNKSKQSKETIDFNTKINKAIRNFKNLTDDEKEEIINAFKRDIEIYNKIGIAIISMLDTKEDASEGQFENYRVVSKFINNYVLKEN